MYDVSDLTALMPDAPHVLILSGVPGVGKSYVARVLKALDPDAVICSADDYVDYTRFDPSMLPGAHQACFRGFLAATMLAKLRSIIIDNTNTSAAEIAPYVLGAESLGYLPLVIRVHPVDSDMAHERNVHGVPEEVSRALYERFTQRDLMPWWVAHDFTAHATRLMKEIKE